MEDSHLLPCYSRCPVLLWGLRDQDPGPGRTNLTAANLEPGALLVLRIICVAPLGIGEPQIPSDLPKPSPESSSGIRYRTRGKKGSRRFSECLRPRREGTSVGRRGLL